MCQFFVNQRNNDNEFLFVRQWWFCNRILQRLWITLCTHFVYHGAKMFISIYRKIIPVGEIFIFTYISVGYKKTER